MVVLVRYSSKYGATEGIAERIARKLREAGRDAEAKPVSVVETPDRYTAFVIGSAAYMGSWRKDAVEFVRGNLELLTSRPLWLFSSGPLGTATRNAEGRELILEAEPKQFDEFVAALEPQGTKVFFGALNPEALRRRDRLVRMIPAGRELLPEGDFRDWVAIDAWAATIAAELPASA